MARFASSDNLSISRFFQGVSERSGLLSIVLYKAPVPARSSQETTQFSNRSRLGNAQNGRHTIRIHLQRSSSHYKSQTLGNLSQNLHVRLEVLSYNQQVVEIRIDV
ncbi:uncharacterized protein LOC117186145 [Drosophila miranda]|uniref:uncharacterized protein LOC117186145 n=1 Tax=Drosophila miranda TaxID=7229 RepID=UPI00143F9D3D|nr:uncharacterized protein LOC117186145 [Drosophila miranda]